MTQLLAFSVITIIIGVFAFIFVGDWLIKIIAAGTIFASIAIIIIPYAIAKIGLWNESMIYVIQMFQIVIVFGGAALGFRRFMLT